MKDKKFLVLCILVSLIGIIPLLYKGFFLTDDGNSMVIRFSAFYEALRAGQFPVRFLSRLNFGYGYPVADFLYPLFMYIGVPIKALGFSFVDTIKIIFGLSFISGALFSFLWFRRLFDDKAAFIGSVIYSFFPYHIYDVYKRGSMGEVLSLGVIPFVLWQIERRNLFWGAIGIFLLILSHNTLAVLFIIFVVLYSSLDIFTQRKKDILFKYYIKVGLLGVGLSSFFSLPAIFDLQYTVFSKTQVSDWSKYFIEFNLVGVLTLFIFATILIFLLIKKIDIKKHRLTVLMLLIGLLSIFLSSAASSSIWNLLPVSFIQFPFRMLSLTIVCSAFLGAILVSISNSKQKLMMSVVLILLSIYSSSEFLTHSVFQNYPDTFYSTNLDSTTVRNEYMPKWVKEIPQKLPSQKAEIVKGKGSIENLVSNGNKIKMDIFSKDKSLIQVNTLYFPGWKIMIDGREKNIFADNKYGIIQFEVDKGTHAIEAKFGETNLRLFADLISLISLFALLGLSLKKYYDDLS